MSVSSWLLLKTVVSSFVLSSPLYAEDTMCQKFNTSTTMRGKSSEWGKESINNAAKKRGAFFFRALPISF